MGEGAIHLVKKFECRKLKKCYLLHKHGRRKFKKESLELNQTREVPDLTRDYQKKQITAPKLTKKIESSEEENIHREQNKKMNKSEMT